MSIGTLGAYRDIYLPYFDVRGHLKTAVMDDVQQVDGAPLSAAPCGYARLSERAHKASAGLTLPKRDEGMQYSTSDASVHRH